MKNTIDSIKLSNADMRQSAQTVMAILNVLQDKQQAIQVMASAVLFLCLCERYNIWPSDVLGYADTMVKKSGGYSQANFEAVKAYMKNEWED